MELSEIYDYIRMLDAEGYPNVFVDVSDYFGTKCEAMKQYKSELCEFSHPRSLKMLEAVARRWGGIVGKELVEAFELVRSVK